jgi:hypothetical protein
VWCVIRQEFSCLVDDGDDDGGNDDYGNTDGIINRGDKDIRNRNLGSYSLCKVCQMWWVVTSASCIMMMCIIIV